MPRPLQRTRFGLGFCRHGSDRRRCSIGAFRARPAALEESLVCHRAKPTFVRQVDAAEAQRVGQPRTIVHCLGDSATLGRREATPTAYPGPLQDLLGEGFLVLNLGIEGSGVSQAAAASAEAALRFPPRLLLLLPGCDDPLADQRLESKRRQGALRGAVGQCGAWLLRHSRLAQFAPLLAGGKRGPGLPPGPEIPDEALLAALDEIAAVAGRTLLVVLLEDLAATPALAGHCQTRQIPFLRLNPLRADAGAEHPLLNPAESRRLS